MITSRALVEADLDAVVGELRVAFGHDAVML